MHRQIVYPGSIPLDTDPLNMQRNAMVGLSKMAAAILGTSTVVNGLSCTPTSPASLQVYVSPGEIYSLQNLDSTAYGSLAADTTHQIMKQGILMDQATLSCPAPGTTGQSINYLVQVAFQETDANAVVLPYYNSSNPATAWSGPSNSGTAQNTQRQDLAVVAVKAGTAATTGTQTTPAPDAGYVGLWVVTVANGQTQITSSSIAQYTGAPILPASGALTHGIQTVTATSTLGAPAGHMTTVVNSASATTQTLPAASSVPAGRRMEFLNINTGAAAITRAGSDTIQVGSSTVSSLSLGNGDTLTLESSGSGWYAIGGTAIMFYAATFLSGAVGSGQTWQDVTGSRAVNTNYTNSTGRPISVSASVAGNSANDTCSSYWQVGGVPNICAANSVTGAIPANTILAAVATVPPGAVYKLVTSKATLSSWIELR